MMLPLPTLFDESTSGLMRAYGVLVDRRLRAERYYCVPTRVMTEVSTYVVSHDPEYVVEEASTVIFIAYQSCISKAMNSSFLATRGARTSQNAV